MVPSKRRFEIYASRVHGTTLMATEDDYGVVLTDVDCW